MGLFQQPRRLFTKRLCVCVKYVCVGVGVGVGVGGWVGGCVSACVCGGGGGGVVCGYV
jgi:hypothetical protein